MIDETRIERALREGPPFRTRYAPQSARVGPAAGVRSTSLWSSWILVAVVLMIALIVGGEALIGSGLIKLPLPNKLPVLTENSAVPETAIPTRNPAATPPATHDPNDLSAWIATGSMVTPRSDGHTVTLLDDGTVLVAGGADGSTSLASAELLDPATLTWTSTGDMTQARWGHTATLLPGGRVLVAGGGDPNGNGRTLLSAEVYDPETRVWTPTGDMAQARTDHTATLLADGRVLVAGGHLGDGGVFVDSAELYDPDTGSWSATGDMTQSRGGHTATLLPSGRVLVAGGVDKPGPGCCVPQSSAELYDPRTRSWAGTGTMIEAGGSAANLLPDGRVLVMGRINGGSDDGPSSAQLYDPVTGSWTITPNIVEPQGGFSASLLPDGRVLVAGGWRITSGERTYPKGIGLATAGLYDPRTHAWIPTRSMNAARDGHVGIVLADGRVLVVGGWAIWGVVDDGSNAVSDPAAEVFDPDGGG